jgi:hypothetical protein
MIIDSPIISGSYSASGSLNQSGNVVISGSLTITGGITGSISGSANSASYAANATSASYALTASYSANVPVTASFANSATSASYALTASFSLNVPVTASFANSATSASYAISASYVLNAVSSSFATSASQALTASYLSGYVSPFPFTGSAIISGSLTVTGSVAVSNLSGSGVRYLVADASGSITAQSASAALKSTEAFTSTAGQTTFSVTNGYSTGYVDVFINGSKLATAEFTDTSGTNIVLATGSFSGDTVEVVKYTPALGVTNNVLRQLTTFTASAGQTVFSASYTPGLLDIFYNGSRLSPSDFTANNGTFFTLATGSAANDILDVLVYSYQVGAFSGIGGQGVTSQIAYFNTTSSITGSNNFTISGSTMTVTGSLIVSGSGTFTNIGPAVFSGSLTSTAGFTGSFSGTATSASFASTASFVANAQSASYVLNAISSSFATSAVTASYADSLIVAGTLTAQTLVVQTITSSVDFVTGSTRFGSILGNTHVFSGSVTMNPNGLFVSSSGNVGIGTTTPVIDLQIGNKTILQNVVGAQSSYSNNVYYNGTNWFLKDAGTGTAIRLNSPGSLGDISFHTIASSSAGANVGTEMDTTGVKMIIKNNGNIGIGTTNVVEGTQPASSISIFPSSSVSSGPLIQFPANGRIRPADTGNRLSIDGNALYLNSYIGGNTIMNTAGGNVGIGTSSPLNVLDVRQASAIMGNYQTIQAFSTDSAAINLGGGISLGGYFTGTTSIAQFGSIVGRKENGTSGNYDGYLAFGTNAQATGVVERMRITSAGLVGIGTTAPPFQLTVARDLTNEGDIVAGQFAVCGATIAGKRLVIGYDTNSNGYGFIESGYLGNTWTYTALQGSGGNVVIGQLTDPGYKLSVNGQPGANGYTAFANYSDLRLKENITDLEATNVLDKICAIRPVTFNYNELSGHDEATRSRRISGFIAQELMEVFPDMVGTINKKDFEYYDTNLSNLNLYLVKALQEANAKITSLEEKLERNNIN